LLSELIQLLFTHITKISDKRFFVRTCKSYNLLLKDLMIIADVNFTVKNIDKITKHCKEKFTLELCYDNYFHLLSESYIKPVNEILILAVSMFGTGEFLETIIDKYKNFNNIICEWAAFGGNLEVLKWARANGCDWSSRTCMRAAQNGHLEVLKWARANGCKWDNSICVCADLNGHFDLSKWARTNGWKWDWYND